MHQIKSNFTSESTTNCKTSMQSSPIVIAIREAAADLAPLRRLLRQPDVVDTPVQVPDDPALCNSFPLHVAVAECCIPALEVLLPIIPLGTFYRVDGFQQTALMMTQRLLNIHLTGPERPARERALRLVVHFFLCAQIKHSDEITREMFDFIDDNPLTKGAIHAQFPSNQNQSLLHVAVSAKRLEIVKFLLQRRCCIYLKMDPAPDSAAGAEGPDALEVSKQLDKCLGGTESQIHKLIQERSEHPDVFISYRQDTERDVALELYHTLASPPHFLNVFLDSSPITGIPLGAKWQQHFVKVITQSQVFVPIASYDGVLKRICESTQFQYADNVLLEHIVAAALPAITIVPVWIGPGCLSPPPRGCVPSPSYPWNNVEQLSHQLPQDIAAMTTDQKNQPTIDIAQIICREIGISEQDIAKLNVGLKTVLDLLKARNGVLFQDAALAAAARAAAPQVLDRDNVKVKCQKLRDALVSGDALPSNPLQLPTPLPFSLPPPLPPKRTQSGILTILNENSGAFCATFAVALDAVTMLCRTMSLDVFATNACSGSVVIHFRLMITSDSRMTTSAGYDQLAAWYSDGTMERDLKLGPLRFALEDCDDNSLPLLLHQQKCNFEELNRQFRGDIQLKPSYSAEELQSLYHLISPSLQPSESEAAGAVFKNAANELEALVEAGFDAYALKAAGYQADALKNVGFDAHALMSGGFSCQELKAAAFDAAALKACGFNLNEPKGAGFCVAAITTPRTEHRVGSLQQASEKEVVASKVAPIVAKDLKDSGTLKQEKIKEMPGAKGGFPKPTRHSVEGLPSEKEMVASKVAPIVAKDLKDSGTLKQEKIKEMPGAKGGFPKPTRHSVEGLPSEFQIVAKLKPSATAFSATEKDSKTQRDLTVSTVSKPVADDK